MVWRYYGRRFGLIGHKPWRPLRAALAARRADRVSHAIAMGPDLRSVSRRPSSCVGDEAGQVVEKDRVELQSMFLPDTAGGGRFGLLIGIIGGPLGMLIGAASRLCPRVAVRPGRHRRDGVGAGRDLDQRLGRAYRIAGGCDEQNPDVVDPAMSDLGGAVLRRFVADVRG